MGTPEISVVIPTYDHWDFLPETIESFDNQTFKDFELIIVVDGLEAGTLVPLVPVQWAMRCDKLIFRKENGGAAAALNDGFALALGKYWTWFDDDNYADPKYLEVLRRELESSELDCVYSSYMRETGTMTDGGWKAQSDQRVISPVYDPDLLIESESSFIGPSFLFRADKHKDVSPHKGMIGHDYEFWLRAEEAGWTFGAVYDTLVRYSVHANRASITHRHQYDAGSIRQEAIERRRRNGFRQG
jgi:glycosyltransferase involved in cell wall biosynthesis